MQTALNKKIRIKSKPRFIIFLTVLILIIALCGGSLWGVQTASGESKQEYVKVEVLPGETLWDIASEQMSYEKDTRHAVYVLQQINDLKDSNVDIGQEIKVPIS